MATGDLLGGHLQVFGCSDSSCLTLSHGRRPPPAGQFRYYDRSRLARINLGPDAAAINREFNSRIVRRIGSHSHRDLSGLHRIHS
jgi:hypothetical protein